MKKYDLLKVLGITFAIIVLISWVIPAGIYSDGSFTSLEMANPIGLFDLVNIPLLIFNNFIEFGLLLLTIGGLYGVLNTTGVYSKLVESVTNKWKKDSKKFLIVTTVLFSLLSSVIGLNSVIFILIPFFATVLLKLGFNKILTLAATVGGLLIGQIGSTLGSDMWGYTNVIFGSISTEMSMFTLILVRLVLLVVVTGLYCMIISKNIKETKPEIKEETKNTKKSNNEKQNEVKGETKIDIPLYEKKESKKDVLPLVIIFVIMFAVLILGVYKWTYTFNIEVFTTIYEEITEFEINGYPLLTYILGSITPLGEWNNYTIIFILVVVSFIIAWLYSIKFSEAFDGFVKGLKQMLVPAFYAVLSCIVFTAVLSLSANFVYTLVDQFTSGEEFSLMGTIASSAVTSFTYSVFPQPINAFAGFFSGLDAGAISVVALIFQTIYGLVMLIAPTSVFLLAGLSYLEVPYKDWINFIWKFALAVLGIIIVVSFIVTTFV